MYHSFVVSLCCPNPLQPQSLRTATVHSFEQLVTEQETATERKLCTIQDVYMQVPMVFLISTFHGMIDQLGQLPKEP